jgi:RNA polymerase sigma-70 factor (ECF subfamily)
VWIVHASTDSRFGALFARTLGAARRGRVPFLRHWRPRVSGERDLLVGDGPADATAFQDVFDTHGAALRRYAERFVRSRETAEDVVQDVFSRLWTHWKQIDLAANVRAYLYSATRTHALNILERRRVERRGLLKYTSPASTDQGPVLLPEGEARVGADDVARAVERVLRSMPARQRQVAALRLRDQLTTAEIARQLGISPRTVETHIARATRLLRERLPALLGSPRPTL